jgi:hypothetical protein
MLRVSLWLLLALAALPALNIVSAAEDLDASAQEASAQFDGASAYAAAGKAAAPADKARLLAELKKRVNINARGTPAEGAALNAILARMMDSPTARALAEKFIQEDAKAVISFEEIPGTTVFEINGKKDFWTSGGHAHTSKVPPEVHLNKAYMQAKTENAPETMAHELFGHTLESKRAERFGVTDAVNYHQNDEANAGLIGWTVGAELGNKITNGWAWIYAANPADYHKRLKSNLAYYAGTLSTEEMRDPRAAYAKRLAETEKLLLRIPIRKEQNEKWLKIIGHLTEKHNMPADSFATLKENIAASLKMIPENEADLREIQAYLQRLIARCDGANGAAWTGNLQTQAQSPYFAEQEAIMAERKKVLEGFMLGKTEESEKPPSRPGQVTWDQLSDMWKADQTSDCGGKL